jgi:hypothetical protein
MWCCLNSNIRNWIRRDRRWGRIGNWRYEEAASLLKRHDNGLDEMGHRSSELLRVLKELLKSDEMQIAVDMIAPLKFVARLQQKFIGGSPLSL